eukprot:g9630.t1
MSRVVGDNDNESKSTETEEEKAIKFLFEEVGKIKKELKEKYEKRSADADAKNFWFTKYAALFNNQSTILLTMFLGDDNMSYLNKTGADQKKLVNTTGRQREDSQKFVIMHQSRIFWFKNTLPEPTQFVVDGELFDLPFTELELRQHVKVAEENIKKMFLGVLTTPKYRILDSVFLTFRLADNTIWICMIYAVLKYYIFIHHKGDSFFHATALTIAFGAEAIYNVIDHEANFWFMNRVLPFVGFLLYLNYYIVLEYVVQLSRPDFVWDLLGIRFIFFIIELICEYSIDLVLHTDLARGTLEPLPGSCCNYVTKFPVPKKRSRKNQADVKSQVLNLLDGSADLSHVRKTLEKHIRNDVVEVETKRFIQCLSTECEIEINQPLIQQIAFAFGDDNNPTIKYVEFLQCIVKSEVLNVLAEEANLNDVETHLMNGIGSEKSKVDATKFFTCLFRTNIRERPELKKDIGFAFGDNNKTIKYNEFLQCIRKRKSPPTVMNDSIQIHYALLSETEKIEEQKYTIDLYDVEYEIEEQKYTIDLYDVEYEGSMCAWDIRFDVVGYHPRKPNRVLWWLWPSSFLDNKHNPNIYEYEKNLSHNEKLYQYDAADHIDGNVVYAPLAKDTCCGCFYDDKIGFYPSMRSR